MLALSTLIADTSSSFRSEVESKQTIIDETHQKLRETSSLLATERRRLSILQQQVADRQERKQRIANLRAANHEQRAHLSRISNGTLSTGFAHGPDVQIGEADGGLEINTQIIPLSLEPNQTPDFSPTVRSYLASLPSTAVLEARCAAYERNNLSLQLKTRTLETRSSELESKLRRVLALALNSDEESMDRMIGKLLRAVDSEGRNMVENGRIGKFINADQFR